MIPRTILFEAPRFRSSTWGRGHLVQGHLKGESFGENLDTEHLYSSYGVLQVFGGLLGYPLPTMQVKY